MKLCRFKKSEGGTAIGLLREETVVLDLTAAGIAGMTELLEADDLIPKLTELSNQKLSRYSLDKVRLFAPVERQEVWAVGVTYLRSKSARMEESTFSATAYDRVYDAPRPELFFKAMPHKVVGHGDSVGIRKDAKWNVPEPELAFV